MQLQIFNLVSLIIDRLGEKIVPCVEKILAFLPRVRKHVLHLTLCLFHLVEIKVAKLVIPFDFHSSVLVDSHSSPMYVLYTIICLH